MNQPAPEVAQRLSVERADVTEVELRDLGVNLDRDFPGASAAEFKRYPVLSEGGWFEVVKHQPTLRCVSRKPWHLLGPVALTSTGMALD